MNLLTLTGLLLFIEACSSAAVSSDRGVDSLYSDLVRRSGPAPSFNVDKYAALGDSFHAGPGAGSKTSGSSWTGSDCYQFSQAVGPQIDGDGRFLKSSPLARGFQFLACTADKIEDMQPQIDKLDGGTNMGTLTIGGNDVYFGSIVNACIYSIYPGKSCDSNKQAARDHMNSQEFKDDLKNLYQKVLDKAPNMNLYILSVSFRCMESLTYQNHVTVSTDIISQYPQFFNDQSDQCSHTCFTFGAPCDGHFLTTDIRRDMNSLVDELNGVIKDQVLTQKCDTADGKHAHGFEQVGRAQSHGSGSIQYIETAPYYDGHRFCEDGVTEPDYNNPNIYFYPFTWTRRNFLQAVPNDLPADCPPKNELGDYGERYDCDVVRLPIFSLQVQLIATVLPVANSCASAQFQPGEVWVISSRWNTG